MSSPVLQLLMAAIIVVAVAVVGSRTKSVGRRHSNHPLFMIVSFDGFRADYLDKVDTPNIDLLAATGVKAKWLHPSFPSLTFPNHHTISTGLFPESHGIVANGFYDPVLDDYFSMNRNEPKWWDTGCTPLYILNELADEDRHSGVMMWVGSASSYFNHTATHVMRYDHGMPYLNRVDTVIDWMLDTEKPANVVFLYFEQPDQYGHEYGPDSDEVKDQIVRADGIVGYIISSLVFFGLYDKINLIVTSDHGMAHTPPENLVDLSDVVNRTYYKAADYSPVLHILPELGKEDIVYDAFKNASVGSHFDVYWRQDVPEEYHYRNNDRIAPIIIITEENYTVEVDHDSPHLLGQHGFNDSLPTMRAIFFAHGPSFKSSYVAEPFRNVDIYPLASHLLGLRPAPNNGSFDDVKDLLKTPSTLMHKVLRGTHTSRSKPKT